MTCVAAVIDHVQSTINSFGNGNHWEASTARKRLKEFPAYFIKKSVSLCNKWIITNILVTEWDNI